MKHLRLCPLCLALLLALAACSTPPEEALPASQPSQPEDTAPPVVIEVEDLHYGYVIGRGIITDPQEVQTVLDCIESLEFYSDSGKIVPMGGIIQIHIFRDGDVLSYSFAGGLPEGGGQVSDHQDPEVANWYRSEKDITAFLEDHIQKTYPPPDWEELTKDPEPEPEPEPEEAPGGPRVISLVEMEEEVRLDEQRFLELEGITRENSRFYYLYVVDKEGSPVPNLSCFVEDSWSDYLAEGCAKLNGLSRNSGLLPFYLYDGPPAPLYLANCNIDSYPYPVQKVELTDELLEKMGKENVLYVIWDQILPTEALASRSRVVTVTVRDKDGRPAPGKRVVFDSLPPEGELRPDIGTLEPREPRYTDENGVAKFSADKIFGDSPAGRWKITVNPAFSDFKAVGSKIVVLEKDSPLTFDITLE